MGKQSTDEERASAAGMTATAVESAVRQLVSVSNWGNSSFVSLPLFYPGGGAISVKIETWSASRFRVSDNGFAFREVESLGAERSFSKTASRIASEQGVSANRRMIYSEAGVAQLAMKIAKVGIASWQIAHHICEKVSVHEEAVIAEGLYDRLVAIFGASRVKPEGVTLVGRVTAPPPEDQTSRLRARGSKRGK